MASAPLTNAQQKCKKHINQALDSVIAYAAPTVPPMGNLTPQGLLEELGYINSARKMLEKTENIVKERYKSLLGDVKEMRSDNFNMTYEDVERTALNQSKAKSYLEEQGILPEYMSTTKVPTMRIKEN